DFDCCLSGLFRPKFSCPPRPGSCGIYLVGSARLRERLGMGGGALVLARQPDQGNSNSGAAGVVCLGCSIASVACPRWRQTAEASGLEFRTASGSASPSRRLV